jgi:CheY-like chemotaxis protein
LAHSPFRAGRVSSISARMPMGYSVLLVEDEVIIRVMVADMLQELGCHLVGEAGRVKEAIDLVQKTEFDIAIMDVNVHGEMTFPVAEAIKARNRPFMFATGYSASSLPIEFSDRPTLQKPFRTETLGKLIEVTIKSNR